MNFIWEITAGSEIILEGQGSNSIRMQWQSEGDFEVSLRQQNECGAGEATVLPVNVNVITTGLPEKENHSVRLFPNPSSGSVTLKFGKNKWNRLRLINSLGQVIEAFNVPINANSFFLEHLPSRLHFIQLESQDGLITKKLIVK